jgi:beta-phosphoglucomutase-like phosphatase (HAD superfamily)
MKHISNYEMFLEDMMNPNTPQGYLNSLSKKPKLKTQQNQNKQQQNQQQTPTDEMDNILQNTEQQKQTIIARKDAIEKGLLNNINQLEPQNQKDVKAQVNDYKNQVVEFDKTVKQIGKLNKTLKKSNVPANNQSQMKNARTQNNL